MATRKNVLRLYITADGKVALRTFDEVGQASTKTADKVEKGAHRQAESFAVVEESSHKLRGAIAGLAGTIGFAGLAFGIADVIKAGQDWQLQQSRLQQSLRNTGLYSQRTMAMLNRSAEQTSAHGGFAAPEQVQSLAQLVRLTGSASKAITDNRAAMELARGTGLDYSQTQKMIGQALTGNVGRLQKYLGIIQPVKSAEFALSQAHAFNIVQMTAQSAALGKLGPLWLKQQEALHNLTPAQVQHAQLLDRQATAAEVVQRVMAKYGGSMRTFSNTTAGAISNAKNAIDLAIEKLGAAALPIVAKIAQAIASFVTYLSNHKQVLVAFGIALGSLGALFAFTKVVEGLTALKVAVLAFAGAEDGATIATIAWSTAMRLSVIGIIITALYLLVTHFKQVKAVAVDAFHWILTAAHNVWSWLKQNWPILAGVFLAPFTFGVSIIVAIFRKQIWGAMKDVWNWIKTAWQNLTSWIEYPFKKAFAAIKWIYDHTIGPIVSVVSSLIGGAGPSKSTPANIARSQHAVGHFGRGLAHPGRRLGGVIPGMSWGGPVGGFGGGDSVLTRLEPGEFVLRKEAVQTIGIPTLNAINAQGSVASHGGPGELYVSAPLRVQAGSRILAETTLHFAAKKASLSGSYVSG